MIITVDYKQLTVPDEILRYCDWFTIDAKREDLRYMDCVYMHMGVYGNDPYSLKQLRQAMPSIKPIFK